MRVQCQSRLLGEGDGESCCAVVSSKLFVEVVAKRQCACTKRLRQVHPYDSFEQLDGILAHDERFKAVEFR